MEKKKVNYTLPVELVEQLQQASKTEHLNMSVLVQLAVQDYLKKLNKKGAE